MACVFYISEPSTIYLKKISTCDKVEVFLRGLKMAYFFRELGKNFDAIKFNIKHSGKYTCNVGEIDKIVPIEIIPLDYTLPEPDRQRMKPFKIVKNNNLTGSPARNFTQTGLIETGTKWHNMPFPLRLFILLHEIAHFYYSDETNCDLWAAKKFVEMGYNQSTAFYGLSKTLNCNSKENRKRIEILFKNLNN